MSPGCERETLRPHLGAFFISRSCVLREDSMKQHHEDRLQAGWPRAFFTLWGGQAASLLGSALVQFALVWWLTAETGSATVLATGTLIATLPGIVIGPVAGALVDRWNRRRVMIAADSLIALATVWLAILFAANRAQVGHIYAIMFIRALGGGFHWPAMQASTTLMVPERHLARVAGLNEMLNGAMSIAAPPLGALLVAALPVQAVLALDVLTALAAILPLLFIPVPQPAPEPGRGARPSLRADLADGLRYVAAWPGLMILLVMALAIKFCINPAFALLPILVTEHFDGGAASLGWIESASGLGMVFGGTLLGVWGGFRRRMVTSMTGLAGMGLGLLLVGLLPGSAFGAALALMAVTGMLMAIHSGPLFAALQSAVAPAMQGRVLSLFSSITTLAAPLSLAIAGPLADAWGAGLWYVLGGGLCVLLGLGGLFIPALVNKDAERASTRQKEQPAAGALAVDRLPE
jgi:DHA3 family macrolide efflux protein-like MFS transporter